jgi:hypothetical protein
VIEQLTPAGGNLGHIVGFTREAGGGHPIGEALDALARHATGFLGAPEGRPALALGALTATLVAGHLAARRRSGSVAVLALLDLLAIGVAVLAASRIVGPILGYLVRWMSMLGVAAAIVAGGALALGAPRVSRATRRAVGAAALVALVLVSAANVRLAWRTLAETPEPAAESEAAGRLAAQVAAALERARVVHPNVQVRSGANREIVLGLLLALDKRGVAFSVEPFGPFRLGGRFAPTGSEDATIVVGEVGSAEGAVPIAQEAGQHVSLARRGARPAPPP